MKTIDGCIELAAANNDLTVFSDSPDHFDRQAEGVSASITMPLSAASYAHKHAGNVGYE